MGSVEFEGEVFHKGISKVALASGLTILDAHQNGKGVPLILESDTHAGVTAGPGRLFGFSRHRNAVADRAGRASFSLPVPSAGSVK